MASGQDLTLRTLVQPCCCSEVRQPGRNREFDLPPSLDAAFRTSWRSSLFPGIGVLWETGTLHPYDAEALASWRLHHHPAIQAIDYPGTQFLQTRDFGMDVVGLNVQVDAAVVV